MMEALTKTKDQGNQFFKTKQYDKALQKFDSVIQEIEAKEDKDYLLAEKQIGKLYVIVLINSALTCINTGGTEKMVKASELCSKALAVDSKNVKALYRKGLALRNLAQIIQNEQGANNSQVLQLYQKAKQNFEKLCLLDKKNQLATKYLSQTVKDIYRVSVTRGQEVTLSSKKTEEKVQASDPYKVPEQQVKKKRTADMSKIMNEYKVEQVTSMVQDKIRNQYLSSELPQMRSDLQKAIRTIQKNEGLFVQFCYRFTPEYLERIKPTFDILSKIVNILLSKGEGKEAGQTLKVCRENKSWDLFWKSLISRQKKQIKTKWVALGLNPQLLE